MMGKMVAVLIEFANRLVLIVFSYDRGVEQLEV